MLESGSTEAGDDPRGNRRDGGTPELTSRPARIEDIRERYPEHTSSFRAWVVEMDGKVVGGVGVALYRPVATLFSWIDDELRPHMRRPAVIRIILNARKACERSRLPVVAAADPDEPTAPGLLNRLGFGLVGSIDGDDVYRFGVVDG